MDQLDLALNNLQWLIRHKTQPTFIAIAPSSTLTRSDNNY